MHKHATNALLALALIGTILGIASLFLPWWSYKEYESKSAAPFATQSLHILPAQYVIESQHLIVYRLIPLNPNSIKFSTVITVVLIIAIILGLFGLYTIYRLDEINLGEIMLFISSLMYFSCPIIFHLILIDTLDPWLLQISSKRSIHFLPYGFETSWGLSFGYYFTITASIVMILNGVFSKYLHARVQ